MDALYDTKIIQGPKKPKKVSFRDGLQTAQIPAQYSQFDVQGRPLNP